MLLHFIFNVDWGQFHPIFIHFPIVLFSCVLICDVLYTMNKKGAFYAGHWLALAGAIMFIPTILTGLEAAESFDSQDHYLYLHKILGFSSGIAGITYAVIRLLALYNKLTLKPFAYLIISLIIVSLIYWTSDYGGLMTRPSTPFSSRESSSTSIARDLPEVSNFTENKLVEYLESKIGVADVVPIFAKAKCVQCHSTNFDGGHPVNFSKGSSPENIFLPRNPDGTLKDLEHSLFYKIVVIQNAMPKDHQLQTIGLSDSDRLILLQWLKNNAPSSG